MDDNLTQRIAWIKARLEDNPTSISDFTIVSVESINSLFNTNILNSSQKFGLENPIQKNFFELLNLNIYSEMFQLIYLNQSRFSFKINKNDFVNNFDSLFYPGDDILVLDTTNQNIICFIDHEEFVILPQ